MCSLQFTMQTFKCKADILGNCSFDCKVCKYDGKNELFEELSKQIKN